jgi:hypothetical protein
MGIILTYLADHPEQRIDSQVLAELVYGKGASPIQLGGALASFSRRIKSRYARNSWPFEAIQNEEKGLWEYKMDSQTAEKIRSLKTSG